MANTKLNTTDKVKEQAKEAKNIKKKAKATASEKKQKAAETERKEEDRIREEDMREPLRSESPIRSSRHKTAADAITPKSSKKKKP